MKDFLLLKKYFIFILVPVFLQMTPSLCANFNRTANGLIIQTKPGVLKIQVCAPNIFHISATPKKSSELRQSLMVPKQLFDSTRWTVNQRGKIISLKTKSITVDLNLTKQTISFGNKNGKVILRETSRIFTPARVQGEAVYHIQQNFKLSPEEAIYGLGQHQDGVMNYRNCQVILVQENTVAVVPFLLSTAGYGILWDNYSKTIFRDNPNGMSLWSEVGDGIDYYFIAGKNPDQVIDGYRKLTGAAPLFGKWAYGYWQSKERYRTQEEIIEVVKEYRRRRLPLDNIVQDWTYWGDLGWNAIDFDRKRFPDPAEMLHAIHNLNTHYMISIWPNFEKKTGIYKEMAAKGFICGSKDGSKNGLYDAFNPEARRLYWQWLNKNLFSIGVDAWWMDATEPEFGGDTPDEIAENAKSLGFNYLGSWARYLNAFSLVSTRGVYEHQRRTTEDKRVFILTRSAYAGQQRYGSVTWSGDVVATWQVFRNQISAGINFSMSGLPYWTTDIGAFLPNNPLGRRDDAYREIYVRWFQFGAFCPIFRSHGSGTPREIWQFGDKNSWAYQSLLKFDNLRYRLLPYIYSLAWKVTSENYTLMRGLPFDFTTDRTGYAIDNEFMFGPAFLVTPVTKKMYFEHTYIGKVIPSKYLFNNRGENGGLTTGFYNGQNFEKLVATRTESQLDFDWNDGSRPAAVNQHYYSIRFTGQVLAPETGVYTFVTTSNDGIRLWVDGKLIIDVWTDHGARVDMGKIKLEAGKRYDLKMEYYQTLGSAITKLAWILPGETKKLKVQKIPATQTQPVYLPKSSGWFDFWSGRFSRGGQTIDSPAPIDEMPLYVKAGSIVPMGPYLQYATEKPADPIELRIYPSAEANFVLYEDENKNYNYEKGIYATIPFHWNEKMQTLTIGKRQGKFPGMLRKRIFRIVLVGPEHGVGVEPVSRPDEIIIYSGKKITVNLP